MSERLEKIKNYYSSMESLHPDIQEDMKWLISRVEELEEFKRNAERMYKYYHISAKKSVEEKERYKQALEEIKNFTPVQDTDSVVEIKGIAEEALK